MGRPITNLKAIFAVSLLVLGLAGCASTPKNAVRDKQCGRFCAELDSCLGSKYDDGLKERLCEVARCESGCRAKIVSPAGYVGAFQFARATWTSLCGPVFTAQGLDRCKPTSARDDLCCASTCAAAMFARGDGGHWPNCGR
jgi:hypothetical protein